MGVSQNYGYLFGSPYNKGCSILGSILGSPYLRKVPYGCTWDCEDLWRPTGAVYHAQPSKVSQALGLRRGECP